MDSRPILSSLTLVLPVHNEAENLTWLLPHVAEVLPGLAGSFDLVVVDDGSTDGSGALATDLAEQLGISLRVVRHQEKSGYGITVGDGLRVARGDFVAFTDADGQFEVADLALLAPLLARADLAAGWREKRSDARAREVVSWVFNTLVAVLYRLPYRDVDCALKLMRREVLDSVDPGGAERSHQRRAVLQGPLRGVADRPGRRAPPPPGGRTPLGSPSPGHRAGHQGAGRLPASGSGARSPPRHAAAVPHREPADPG